MQKKLRTELEFPAPESAGAVSAILIVPPGARLLYVLAHGAGAGMRHPFMEAIAEELSEHSIATFRYQFPYMQARSRRPDPAPILEATVRSAISEAVQALPGVPLVAGGKSMGGRMTSQAVSKKPLPGLQGLIFLGFPLHPPGRPGTERADHLAAVGIPMLFLQGTRDELADLTLLRAVCDRLGKNATLHVVDGADHSFKVLKRTGRSEPDILRELSRAVSRWALDSGLLEGEPRAP
ncbi:MAG: alpha/beta family hydrolase [Gemmatimonadaceae bacterium]